MFDNDHNLYIFGTVVSCDTIKSPNLMIFLVSCCGPHNVVPLGPRMKTKIMWVGMADQVEVVAIC